MIDVSWEKDRILAILNTIDSEIWEYPQSELSEIADKLQEVLNTAQEYLSK